MSTVDLDKLSPDLRKQVEAELNAQQPAIADATHICMLLDRTGSMSSIASDTIGGVNTFLEGQRKVPGACTFTLIQFDAQDPHEVVQDFVNMADAKDLTPATFVPRGSTPLYDAMCKAVAATEKKLASLNPRPGKVVFVVVTDGEENCSQECVKSDAVAAVKRCEAQGWNVVYLGVGIDAMDDAGQLGVKGASTLNVGKSSQGVMCAFACTSDNIAGYRGSAGPQGDAGLLGYTVGTRDLQAQHGAVKTAAPS